MYLIILFWIFINGMWKKWKRRGNKLGGKVKNEIDAHWGLRNDINYFVEHKSYNK